MGEGSINLNDVQYYNRMTLINTNTVMMISPERMAFAIFENVIALIIYNDLRLCLAICIEHNQTGNMNITGCNLGGLHA